MQMSRPVPTHESWLGRRDWASVFGPLFAYMRAHASQLVRFVSIGTGLMALNLSFLYCLRTLLHFSAPISVTIVYAAGTLLHFVAHRWITYRAHGRPMPPQGLRYTLMVACNFMILQALVALAARVSISPYFAFIASTGCTMVFNFLAMTHFVFAKERRP